MYLSDLEQKSPEELAEMARDLGVNAANGLRKEDLVMRLMQAQSEKQGNLFGGGVLDISEDGYGFLRGSRFLPGPNDTYVSQTQVRRFGLRDAA